MQLNGAKTSTDEEDQPVSPARRMVLGALAAAGAGFMLFGPRGRDDVPRGRLVLNYWEKWTGHEGAAMQRLVDRFNASQQELWVRYIPVAAIDQKAQVSIAGAAPPDILGLWHYNVATYAESGALMSLDDLQLSLPEEERIRPERIAPAVRAIMRHADPQTGVERTWCAVSSCGTLALYYNRAMLGSGLRPPRTIEELDSINEALLDRDGSGGIRRMGFHHREPGWWPYLWGASFGGSLVDERTGAATIDSRENVRAYEWVRSYPDRYGLDHLKNFFSSFGAYDTAQNAFLDGKLGCVIQGPWLANIIQRYRPELDYGVVPVPRAASVFDERTHLEEPAGLLEGDTLVIPRGVKHPDAAMRFVAFTQRPENIEYLAKAHFKGTTLVSASNRFTDGHPNRGIEVFNKIAQSPRAFSTPRTRVWPEIRDRLGFAFDEVCNSQRAPAAILAEAQAAAVAAMNSAAVADARRRAVRGGSA